LQMTGALQKGNRMTIESLLNPDSERSMLDDSTDQAIFEAVMHSREAHENSEIYGSDDDKDDDAFLSAFPSRREALEAAATMQKFISEMDDPFARKLESLLEIFGRETQFEATCSMVNASITDFFHKK
ncbi:hypothetical protein BT96DRAFT_821189, partial [Gymnopus androsaceus JB14]